MSVPVHSTPSVRLSSFGLLFPAKSAKFKSLATIKIPKVSVRGPGESHHSSGEVTKGRPTMPCGCVFFNRKTPPVAQ